MSDDMFQRLRAPFDPAVVSWRPGSMSKDKTKARALAYLDARDVMRRLDEVCGPEGWQCEYVPMPNGTTCCRIGLSVGPSGAFVWKSNGAGATDIEAEKGAYSDAFKRAAVLWGVGQYLYDVDSPWVTLNQWKQIPDEEMPRLHALLSGGKQKSAYQARKDGDYPRLQKALRECGNLDDLQQFWKHEQEAIQGLPAGWRRSLTDEKDRMKTILAEAA